MESKSRSGSARRKPASTWKVRLSFGKKSKAASSSDSDELSDLPVSFNQTSKTAASCDSIDSDSIPELPEGTVIVNPEPVHEKRPKFQGPEFSKVSSNIGNLEIFHCTSCNRQVNPNVKGAAKRHPDLKVLICKKCYSYYKSGEIVQDSDGLDEQCRWCSEGGKLMGCDYCHNAFCKQCILRNFGRAELTKINGDDDTKWKCYICDRSQILKLTAQCDDMMDKIEKQRQLEKVAASLPKSEKSSKKSSLGSNEVNSKVNSKPSVVNNKTLKPTQVVSNITIYPSCVEDVVCKLTGISKTFITMLEVMKTDLEIPFGLMSPFDPNVNNRMENKRNRYAGMLQKGLDTYTTSIASILSEQVELETQKATSPIAVNENSVDDVEIIETSNKKQVKMNGCLEVPVDVDDESSEDQSKALTPRSPQKKRKVNEIATIPSVTEKKNKDKTQKPKEKQTEKWISPRENKESIVLDDDIDVNSDDVDNVSVTTPKEDDDDIASSQNTKCSEDRMNLSQKNEVAQLELLQELADELSSEQQKDKQAAQMKNTSLENDTPNKETEEVKDKDMDGSDDKFGNCDDDNDGVLEIKSDDSKIDDDESIKQKGPSNTKGAKRRKDTSSVDDRSDSECDNKKSQNRNEKKSVTKKLNKKSNSINIKQNESENDVSSSNLLMSCDDEDFEEDRRKTQTRKGRRHNKVTKSAVSDSGSEDFKQSRAQRSRSCKKTEAVKKMSKKSARSQSTDDSDDELDKDIERLSRKPRLGRNAKSNVSPKTKESDKKEKGRSIGKKKKSETSGSDGDDDDDGGDDDDDDKDIEDENSNVDIDEIEKPVESMDVGVDEKNEIAKKAILDDMDEDDVEEVGKISSDDSDASTEKKSKKNIAKNIDKKKEELKDDEDSDVIPSRKNRLQTKLLNTKLSESLSSDSDFEKTKKSKKRKRSSGSSSSEELTDSESESEEVSGDEVSGDNDSDSKKKKKKKKKGKRGKKGRGNAGKKKLKRIKAPKNSSDEESEEGDGSGLESGDEKSSKKGHRKEIRKIKSDKKLKDETRKAVKAEESRRERVLEKQKKFNNIVQITDNNSPTKCPMTTQLILERDKETEEPIIEVNKNLVRKLKPHQVEAVQFMYDCCCESVKRMKNQPGSGCILAHCMGLGKTLSVVTFVHTIIKHYELTNIGTCLIVCPLNTVLNWVNEWDIWLQEKEKLEIYEMAGVKSNISRMDYLLDWQKNGGIMIMGYEMYRNLSSSQRAKSKKMKKVFAETLVDPGPDIVVCDEGHILKNDASAISKAMNTMKTRRRIVLTGTPLQNNLIEYHCMVSFVKPSLLGTRKEFGNRFVNPIVNGQCSDSTPHDVKIMKRRAHIIHEKLAGCVQRRDYSALTKFLPPKMEYVILVRLTPTQITLYEKYLEVTGQAKEGQIITRGARLFADYQNLMKIWTHPWVLKLAEIRDEAKRQWDDEDDIDDDGSDLDSFIDDEKDDESSDMTNTESDDSALEKKKGKKSDASDSGGEGTSGGPKRRTRSRNPKDSDGEEIVKDWKTRSRGGDDGFDIDVTKAFEDQGPAPVSNEWWAEYIKLEDAHKVELSGKLTLLFEILKLAEEIGDKVLVFSQSLLSLNIIEDFLEEIDRKNQEEADVKRLEAVLKKKERLEKAKLEAAQKMETDEKEKDKKEEKMEEDKKEEKMEEDKKEDDKKDDDKMEDDKKEDDKMEDDKMDDDKMEDDKKKDEKKVDAKTPEKKKDDDDDNEEEEPEQFGKSWTKGADYYRMDGSTSVQLRSAWSASFNDPENYRARLFLISTRAGSLGINLVAANRVIIFDASWNPSHDIQSIFRVYRFGQLKPCYIYRFLAQGTMEEKIYERQVTKQSLAQRVVDEHQIDRHFTAADLQELYKFRPDRLDDPANKDRPTLALPQDVLLAEIFKSLKDTVVAYHTHDSLLENKTDQELSEEDKKAAWEEYENEKAGLSNKVQTGYGGGMGMLSANNVMQIVQMVRAQYPNLPPDMFQAQVQNVLQRQIMLQQDMQKRQIEQQQMLEMERLRRIREQINKQQSQINIQGGGMSRPNIMSQFNARNMSNWRNPQQQPLQMQSMMQRFPQQAQNPKNLAMLQSELERAGNKFGARGAGAGRNLIKDMKTNGTPGSSTKKPPVNNVIETIDLS